MGNNSGNEIITSSVVILTGASSGLGKQMAIKLSKNPIKLVITGRNKQRLQQTKTICESYHCASIHTFVGDLTEESVCQKLISETLSLFNRLDLLVLNAGVNAHAKFSQLKELNVFDKLMKTNFYANLYLTKYALPSLRKTKGKIVVISSASGKFGLPERSAYCASKFALTGFFESLRTQEENISICMVYPTSLDTPMRSNDILGLKETSNHSENKQQSAEKAAEMIVTNMLKKGHTDIYIPTKIWVGTCVQPLFPNFMREKLKNAAKL